MIFSNKNITPKTTKSTARKEQQIDFNDQLEVGDDPVCSLIVFVPRILYVHGINPLNWRKRMLKLRRFLSLLILVTLVLATIHLSAAQQQDKKKVTAEDYAHAEKFLRKFTSPLVFGASMRPNWVDDSYFWYRSTIPKGYEFVLVDLKKKKRADRP